MRATNYLNATAERKKLGRLARPEPCILEPARIAGKSRRVRSRYQLLDLDGVWLLRVCLYLLALILAKFTAPPANRRTRALALRARNFRPI